MSLHPKQWRIFSEHHNLDESEKLELLRDIAEYAMAFHNVEGVKAVQEARDARKRLENEQATNIFAEQVAAMFGRALNADLLKEAKQQELAGNPPPPPIVVPPAINRTQQEDIITIKRPQKDD